MNKKEEFVKKSSKNIQKAINQISNSILAITSAQAFIEQRIDNVISYRSNDIKVRKYLDRNFNDNFHRLKMLDYICNFLGRSYDKQAFDKASDIRNMVCHSTIRGAMSSDLTLTFQACSKNGKALNFERLSKDYFDYYKTMEDELSKINKHISEQGDDNVK